MVSKFEIFRLRKGPYHPFVLGMSCYSAQILNLASKKIKPRYRTLIANDARAKEEIRLFMIKGIPTPGILKSFLLRRGNRKNKRPFLSKKKP
jgi:hypothetical protein